MAIHSSYIYEHANISDEKLKEFQYTPVWTVAHGIIRNLQKSNKSLYLCSADNPKAFWNSDQHLWSAVLCSSIGIPVLRISEILFWTELTLTADPQSDRNPQMKISVALCSDYRSSNFTPAIVSKNPAYIVRQTDTFTPVISSENPAYVVRQTATNSRVREALDKRLKEAQQGAYIEGKLQDLLRTIIYWAVNDLPMQIPSSSVIGSMMIEVLINSYMGKDEDVPVDMKAELASLVNLKRQIDTNRGLALDRIDWLFEKEYLQNWWFVQYIGATTPPSSIMVTQLDLTNLHSVIRDLLVTGEIDSQTINISQTVKVLRPTARYSSIQTIPEPFRTELVAALQLAKVARNGGETDRILSPHDLFPTFSWSAGPMDRVFADVGCIYDREFGALLVI